MNYADLFSPKRHYKKESLKSQIPEFSQVGTIIEGPTEYFSSRISNKDRKQTLVEEILSSDSSNHRLRSKYDEIQPFKISGKKAHYKRMKAQRHGAGSRG